jgi:hypothetical protein
MLKLWILLCLSLLPASLVCAQETTTSTTTTTQTTTVYEPPPYSPVEVEARYWMPDVEGEAFITEGGSSTMVDLEDDLGMDEAHVPNGKLKFNFNEQHSVRLSYLYLNAEGNKNLSRTIVYNGQTYPVSTNVDSELNVHYFTLGWFWNFIQSEPLKAGLFLDVKGISAESSLKAPSVGLSNDQDFTGAAPTPGAMAEFKILPQLSAFGEISGLPAGGYGHFFDAEGGLKWDITPNFALTGGYRVIDIEVDYKDDSGSITLPGPFVGGILKF